MLINYLVDVDIIIDGVIYNSDNYSMQFSISRYSYNTDNTAVVTIDYLSKETRNTILEKAKLDGLTEGEESIKVSIMAGYKSTGKGLIFYGTIAEAETTNTDGVKLTLMEGSKEFSTEIININYKGVYTTKELVKNIMSMSSFGVGVIDCSEVTYVRGKTYSCTLKEALEDLAKPLNVEVKVIKNILYFVRKEYFESEVEVSAKNGLKSVTKKDYYYVAKMYFNNIMQENTKLKIKKGDGEILDVIIRTVSHLFSKNKFETILECDPLVVEVSDE